MSRILIVMLLYCVCATSAHAEELLSYNTFCAAYAALCVHDKQTTEASPAVSLDRFGFATLIRVNDKWNNAIMPKEDTCDVHTHTTSQGCDVWSPPSATGDCEEYAIAKKLELLQYGLQASQLLLTVVRDSYGNGHLVLVVRTNRGNYVLDNLRSAILSWEEAGYEHYMHQRPNHPVLWTYESF